MNITRTDIGIWVELEYGMGFHIFHTGGVYRWDFDSDGSTHDGNIETLEELVELFQNYVPFNDGEVNEES